MDDREVIHLSVLYSLSGSGSLSVKGGPYPRASIAGNNVASLGTGLGAREPDMAGDITTVAGRGTGEAARDLRRGDTGTLLADRRVLSDGVGDCSSW